MKSVRRTIHNHLCDWDYNFDAGSRLVMSEKTIDDKLENYIYDTYFFRTFEGLQYQECEYAFLQE